VVCHHCLGSICTIVQIPGSWPQRIEALQRSKALAARRVVLADLQVGRLLQNGSAAREPRDTAATGVREQRNDPKHAAGWIRGLQAAIMATEKDSLAWYGQCHEGGWQ